MTIAEDLAELEGRMSRSSSIPTIPTAGLSRRQISMRWRRHLPRVAGLLIVDEAFVDFLEPGASAIPGMPAQGMIILRSFGKAYGLPGLRLGFAVAPKALAEKLRAALRSLAGLGRGHRDRFKSLTGSAWLADGVDAPHGTGLGARQHTWLRPVFLVGGSNALFRLACHNDAQVWFDQSGEKWHIWYGVSQRIRSGCALVSRARILTSPGSLVHSKSSKPANSRNN